MMGHLHKTNNFQDECYSLCKDGPTSGPAKGILHQPQIILQQSYLVDLFTCYMGPCIHVVHVMNCLLWVGQGFVTWDANVISDWSVGDLKYSGGGMYPTLSNFMPCAPKKKGVYWSANVKFMHKTCWCCCCCCQSKNRST